MSRIYLKGMKFNAFVGHYIEEQQIGTPINIDLSIWVDTKKVECSDNIDDALNYQHIYCDIKNIVKNNNFNLIESLSNKIIRTLLEKYQQIDKIKIELSKINIQMGGEIGCVGIEIEQNREENK